MENRFSLFRWSTPMAPTNGVLEKKGPDCEFDLFGSDDEDDEEKVRITAARLKV